eukprot:m.71926 g.71926  ORF g.71926 m.71926 type:complete len:613 (-) comp7657_c0_seq3:217-2055(-)
MLSVLRRAPALSAAALSGTRSLTSAEQRQLLPIKRRMRKTQPLKLNSSHTYGVEIIYDPSLNKGTGFTQREQDRLGLRGLVPPHMFTLEEQVERAYVNFHRTGNSGTGDDVVAKYLYMIALQDRNETLFYKMVTQYIAEMAPIIYTPTVGYACQNAQMLFRRPRGLYFTARDRGEMHAIIQNWPRDEVDVIVVTDGSRILGLGDLGVQGMAIPIGKLSLYVAAGGIPPTRCLPAMIDVGTNNKDLQSNPYYMGLRHPRIEGTEYIELVDEFMMAVQSRFPKALIQFEDFKTPKAEMLLKRYRNTFRCFNDDIQGTGAVTLAGMLAAHRKTGNAFTESRIVCVGAGSAGLGVCAALVDALIRLGLSKEEAHKRFWLVDDKGLITSTRGAQLQYGQAAFARSDDAEFEGQRLEALVDRIKPTVLLGLSGVGGLFTEGVVRRMAAHAKEPIIFAMSNPTHLSECSAEQAFTWTGGRAVFASGSPFGTARVTHPDGRTTEHTPSQSNNMFIFPGVGLGVVASGAPRVPDRLFFEAAVELAKCVDDEALRQGKVFPPISNIREVSHAVAVAVAKAAQEDGLATITPDDGDWAAHIEDAMWEPSYPSLVLTHSTPTYH